ncbi:MULTISPECIES: GNAT family N-acetyltransferase [Cupriavidus]|uniref:N-acetylglutamate synthase, GNAT family n=1 Tax=Cupriavidus taiwanensis TaxID=164546 RepID=A0A976AJE7_9BURK|nr:MULTISPECIES: GNAT family N-acetyltransferase [Cupriavidus]MEC3769414.1 GNAT family N-acetyltransferase [Cupriavidus sp. SS-3]SOY84192.1 putative acetyltransferase [Cupriavidus taiwanensis]SOY88249.1 putative acetyltransferase [Cupriavidus taiwanensis]SPD63205.1 N-acetylglutamate synthase, GNAT family [Cupriavidus taiwanensis]
MAAPRIRLAAVHDLPRLPDIELAAAALFPENDLPALLRLVSTPHSALAAAQRDRRLWVAEHGGEVAGFALASRNGACGYLDEMDVHPDHGRRGIGRALVGTVQGWARASGLRTLNLTTFAHLPWNAPFYASMGFRRLEDSELCPLLSEALAAQRAAGLRQRIAMQQAF